MSPGAITALAFSSSSAPGRSAYRKFSLPTDGKNRVSPVLNFTVTPFFISGVRMPVIGCDSQGKKMVAEAGYMCNVAEQ